MPWIVVVDEITMAREILHVECAVYRGFWRDFGKRSRGWIGELRWVEGRHNRGARVQETSNKTEKVMDLIEERQNERKINRPGVRFHIPNSNSWDKSNTFFISFFAFIFVRAILCLTIECCGRLGTFERSLKFPNATSLFVAVSVPSAITPNHSFMNRLL